ncbi:endoplasmic reticulum retention protein [Saitoella coloradoensis]
MNIFRLLGDLSHLASIFILLHKIRTTKSCAGISFRSQALYVLVYLTRYLDLLWGPWPLYNTVMKLFFIGSSVYVLYLMKFDYRPSHDMGLDNFKVEYLIGGSFVMALLFNLAFTFDEVMWSFSLWLESVAILPQLFLLQRTGEAETITTHYIFALGAYRALYIPNWLYRWVMEGRVEFIAVFAGIVQTIVYADFFYVYFTKVIQGQKFELPA